MERARGIRGEEAPIGGQNGDGDVIALVDLAETLAEKVVGVLVQGIELLGVVEGDDGDGALVGDGDEILDGHFGWFGGCIDRL